MPSLEKFVTHVEYSTLPLKNGTGSPASKAASVKSGGGSSAGSDDGADGSGAGGSDDVPEPVRAATSLDNDTASVRPSDVARDFTRKLAAAVAAGINGSNAAKENNGAADTAAAMTTGEKSTTKSTTQLTGLELREMTGLERRAQDAQKMAQAAKNMVQNSSQGPTNGKRARGDENDASGPAAKKRAQHPPAAAAEVQAPRANEAEPRLKMMEQLLQMEEIASQTRQETEHCLQMQEYLASQKQKAAGAAATLARPPPAPGVEAAHEDAEGAGVVTDGAALRNKVQAFLVAQEAALAGPGKKKAAGGEVIELDDDSGDESEDTVPLTKMPAVAPVGAGTDGNGQKAPPSSTASTGAAAGAAASAPVGKAPTSSMVTKKVADNTQRAGSTAFATAMVLPEVHTEALWEKMCVLSAQVFAPLSIADQVPALSDALLGAIALRVPVSSQELRECGLSEEQVRLFGKIIIRNICEFVRERGLEMHLLGKHPRKGDFEVMPTPQRKINGATKCRAVGCPKNSQGNSAGFCRAHHNRYLIGTGQCGSWECKCGQTIADFQARCGKCHRWRGGIHPGKKDGSGAAKKGSATAIETTSGGADDDDAMMEGVVLHAPTRNYPNLGLTHVPPDADVEISATLLTNARRRSLCKVIGCGKLDQSQNDGFCRMHFNLFSIEAGQPTWTCACGTEMSSKNKRCGECNKWREGKRETHPVDRSHGISVDNSTVGNGVAGTYGRNNIAPVQAPTAQPRHAFPMQQQQFPRPNASLGIDHGNQTANTRTQPAPQPTTQTAPVVHSSIPNKALERWSEYRIDAASTVEDLESIRRRLLSLVDRVDARLRERRLVDAVTEMGGAGTENVEELSTQELIDRLSAKADEPEDGDVGDIAGDANGQRSADDASGGGIASDERQRLPTTCPLCFDKIASPASCGTCEICEEKGICGQCHSVCSCCRRSTCADCLMGCDGCSSRHHCSDCMMYGGGKCVVCRPKKSAGYYAQIPDGTLPQKTVGRPTTKRGSNLNHDLSSLASRANGMVGYPQFYPPTKPLALPPAPGPPQSNACPPPKPSASFSLTQTTANGIKTTQGYSIHRFIISEAGTIGINITVQTKTRKCVISTVHPDSIALKYGIQVNDEILPPNSNGRVDPSMDVYKLFLEAAKHRPLQFEVKRLFNPASAAAYYPLERPHALHKFVISEPGPLGMSIQKSLSENHYISPISSVTPESLSALYGLKVGDVICKTDTNGREKVIVFDWFLEGARSGKRPLVIEVWRALSASAPKGARQTGQKSGSVNGNPFIFFFPTSNQPARTDAASGKAAGNAQATKPATANKSKDTAPIILLDDDGDSGSDTESTSDKRSSWRCNYCPRLFDEYDDAMNHELTCEQRDDSNGEEKKND